MPLDCDPAALLDASKCFCYADPKQADAVVIYLLNQISGLGLTPAQLAENAKCYCYPDRQVADAAKTYLLCQIASQ